MQQLGLSRLGGAQQPPRPAWGCRWIITKRLTPEHEAVKAMGFDLRKALDDEGEEASHAFFCLLTYLGFAPKYVRFFGFGHPFGCTFPAKALDDGAKPGRRNAFLQVMACAFCA